MQPLLVVMLGGAVGSGARYLAGLGAARLLGTGFPWGTLVVNVAGSFAMGLLVAILGARAAGAGPTLHLLIATGFLGGFTTFSAFSLDVMLLWQRGAAGLAVSYIAASLVISLAGIAIGMAIGRALA